MLALIPIQDLTDEELTKVLIELVRQAKALEDYSKTLRDLSHSCVEEAKRRAMKKAQSGEPIPSISDCTPSSWKH